MKTTLILQARMGSTRLAGKILMQVLGKPLLQWELERVLRCKEVDQVVLATTDLSMDDPVAKLASEMNVTCFRGSSENVLDRYYQAAKKYHADLIVRVTGDCPLIDPEVIDLVVKKFKEGSFDYLSNTRVGTYPRGMDVEVFSISSLHQAHLEAKEDDQKEHVTPFIYQHPERFRLGNIALTPARGDLRLTVDTQEDFDLIKKILETIAPKKVAFTLQDLLNLLNEHPEWMKINAHVKQKSLLSDR
jgi:spore coat polysaccharide biosynthesis protein SpsF